ncbi:MAG TPA: DUF4019 domain-containing protein [Gemmatimonadales bacterium]
MTPRGVLVLLAALIFARPARAQSSDASAAVPAAQTAATAWLALVDTGDYDGSWDHAALAFRTRVEKPTWGPMVRKARESIEPLGPRKLMTATFATTLPNAPKGSYVVIQYETKAADGQTVVETVTPMKDPDGKWRVSGYYIRPK